MWLSDLWEQIDWKLVVLTATALLIPVIAIWRSSGSVRVVAMFWVAGGAIVFVVYVGADSSERWGCALALLPAMMISQHAVFLRLVRMPFRDLRRRSQTRAAEPAITSKLSANTISAESPAPSDTIPIATSSPPSKVVLSGEAMSPRSDLERQRFEKVFAVARLTSDRYFSASTLAVRYGAPALAVAVIGIIGYYFLFSFSFSDTKTEISIGPVVFRIGPIAESANIRAAQLGAAGAYVYVLLYLAQRNFRYDVTSGGAMWCAAVLALGPLLACAMSHFLQEDQVPSENPKLKSEVIYFIAGLAPRHATSFIVESVRRLWVSPSNTNSVAPRTIPITQVRGITIEVAERLNEEGILDLYGLAMADPLRLIRNTNFDKRQIISWIDEAILIAVLPEQWQALEREGFTGAIDLVWLLQSRNQEDYRKLSARLKLDDESILIGVVNRLAEDAQLQLVSVLYQSIDRLDAETDHDDASRTGMRLPLPRS